MPLHKNRVWSVEDRTNAAELAHDLTNMSWCLCNGFRIGSYLILNDATSEDGAQEYAVIREATMQQVESWTVGWMTEEQAYEVLVRLLAGAYDDETWVTPGPAIHAKQVQTPAEHGTCWCCA